MITYRHSIATTPARFWEAMLDPAFQKRMYFALGCSEYSIVPGSLKETENTLRWKTRVASPAPAGIRSVVKIIRYEEDDFFQAPDGPYKFLTRAGEMWIRGTITATLNEDKRSMTRLMTVEVLPQGITAHMLKTKVASGLGPTYDRSARYLNEVLGKDAQLSLPVST
jgi:hypothetical protein